MTDDQQAIRDRILVAALAHVAFDGWTRRTLKAGVKDAGMSPDMALRAFAGGRPERFSMNVFQTSTRKSRSRTTTPTSMLWTMASNQ